MKTRQWILILIGAALMALMIRIFLFETIRVANSAMSESQKDGDILFVEKWSLGARIPTTIGIPFTPETLFGKKTYLELGKKSTRSYAFGAIERNDLLAFNDPLSLQNLDQSPILLSRCVGLPGENFILEKGKTVINGKKMPRHQDVSYCYSFPLTLKRIIEKQLIENHIYSPLYKEKDSGFVYLTRHEWYSLYARKALQHGSLRLRVSRFDEQKIVIPSKGCKIVLNDSTFRLYGKLINQYEGVQLKQDTSGAILKNGHKVRLYTFKENYYFLINDHQGYLNDSRSFGLLPERFILGKAWMVFFSPSSKRFLKKI